GAHKWIAGAALKTGPAGFRGIGGDDAVSRLEFPHKSSDLHGGPTEFVSQNDGRPARPFPIDDMKISTTDTCIAYFQFDFVWCWTGFWPLFEFEIAFTTLCLDDCFHFFPFDGTFLFS